MSNRSAIPQADVENLRTAYRDAFEKWVRQVVRLQQLRISGCGEACSLNAEAQTLTDVAEVNYRAIRDRLAARMMD